MYVTSPPTHEIIRDGSIITFKYLKLTATEYKKVSRIHSYIEVTYQHRGSNLYDITATSPSLHGVVTYTAQLLRVLSYDSNYYHNKLLKGVITQIQRWGNDVTGLPTFPHRTRFDELYMNRPDTGHPAMSILRAVRYLIRCLR